MVKGIRFTEDPRKARLMPRLKRPPPVAIPKQLRTLTLEFPGFCPCLATPEATNDCGAMKKGARFAAVDWIAPRPPMLRWGAIIATSLAVTAAGCKDEPPRGTP